MSAPDWNPVTVEAAIHATAEEITNLVMQCDTAYRTFLKADQDFDLAEAKAYLSFDDKPAHERKYHTVQDPKVILARNNRDVHEATHRLKDRQMKAAQSKLDAYRSIGTSVRQAYSVAGRGEG